MKGHKDRAYKKGILDINIVKKMYVEHKNPYVFKSTTEKLYWFHFNAIPNPLYG